MGNHEWPCEVCGDNKFGLSGCGEEKHSVQDLKKARDERTARGLATTYIDIALAWKDRK